MRVLPFIGGQSARKQRRTSENSGMDAAHYLELPYCAIISQRILSLTFDNDIANDNDNNKIIIVNWSQIYERSITN